jgi:hypothetical protein
MKDAATGRHEPTDLGHGLRMGSQRITDIAPDLGTRPRLAHETLELEAALGEHAQEVVVFLRGRKPIDGVTDADGAVKTPDEG